MIRKIFILILVMYSMVSLSCATLTMERTVSSNNEFYSSYSPKLQVNVKPNFTYIGEFKDIIHINFRDSMQPSLITYCAYSFVEADEKDYVQKGVIIRISTIDPGGRWLPDVYEYVKEPIISGFTKINGEQYQHCTTTSANIRDPKIENFITDKGYHLSNFYLVKSLGRIVDVENRTRFEICYIENLSHFDSTKDRYWKANLLSNEQIEFIKEFEKNAQNSFQLLTSTQPIVKSGSDKFVNMEEKLKALKIIYDKGLITEKEYSDRKRQILEESLK